MSGAEHPAATEQRPWCECDPEYEGRCPYPCQIDADEKREAASAASSEREILGGGRSGRTGDRAVALARRFHEAYEEFAPAFDYETRDDTRVPWEELPENNRRLMIAVCVAVLHDIEAGRV